MLFHTFVKIYKDKGSTYFAYFKIKNTFSANYFIVKTETDKRFIDFSEGLKSNGIISTYKAFCESISISQQVYNDIKAGRRSVTIDIITNTCITYHVSADDFLLGQNIFKTKTPKNVVKENDHINDHIFDHKRKLQKRGQTAVGRFGRKRQSGVRRR